MAEKIKLKNPILIDGKETKELSYDVEKITNEAFLNACSLSAAKNGTLGGEVLLRENDNAMHFHLGVAAICAENPSIDQKDLERVMGMDNLKIANIGRVFIMGFLSEASTEKDSEEPSETTQELSTPEQES